MIAQARGKQEGVVFVLSCLHCTKNIVLPYVEACEKKVGGDRIYLFVSELEAVLAIRKRTAAYLIRIHRRR